MPVARINGIDLFYEVHGDGPVVVLAHGRNGNRLTWWQQVPTFARYFQVLTFDHRGFGQSIDLPERPGRSMYVRDLAALIDHLGFGRVSIVGQSMGGWTALGYAVAFPDRVERLVLADTTAGIAAPSVVQAIRGRAKPPADFLERALSEDYRRDNPAGAFLYAQIAGLNMQDQEPLETLLESTEGPQVEILGALKIPTLFAVGEYDPVVLPSMAQVCGDLFPDSRVRVFEEAGHSVYFEKPQEFNQEIIAFLASGSRQS